MATTEDHIGCFVKSTKAFFSTMLGLDVHLAKLYTCELGHAHLTDVSGIIGLSGDVQGVFVIRFPSATGLAVASRFMGEEAAEIDGDVTDAIGEIANIVAGSAKADFAGLSISVGLPTVVEGSDYNLHFSRTTPTLCAHMASDLGGFALELGIKFKGE